MKKKNHRQLHGNKTKKLSVGQFVRPSTVTPKYVYNDGITLVGGTSSTLSKASNGGAGQRSHVTWLLALDVFAREKN